jgi:hypothetical protein
MKTKAQNYKALLSKTQSQIEAEQLDLRVEQAELNFQQGLLSLKGKLITAEGEVKKQEAAVKSALKSLEDAKSSSPEQLVQNLVNAKTAVDQSQLNLESSQEAYDQLKEMYNFLEKTKAELF